MSAKGVPRKRKSSSPFISGDSFLQIADSVFLNRQSPEKTGEKLEQIRVKSMSQNVILFMEASFLESERNIGIVNNWISRHSESVKEKCSLIIHNGDKLPNEQNLNHFSKSFSCVYAVNARVMNVGVQPLPIGLENRHHKKNGFGREFKLSGDCFFKVNPQKSKQPLVFGSFAIGTNKDERGRLRALMAAYGLHYVEPNLKPKEYRVLVKQNQFVLSPPGNGFDCHRTWEAIYLGAIPVVLADCLHPDLVSKFPIHAVSSWEDFLRMTDDELQEVVNEFNGKRYPALSFPYWAQSIRNVLKNSE